MNKRPPSKEEEELGVRIAKGFHCRSEESPLTVQSTAFNGIEKERELTTEERECEGKETPKKCGSVTAIPLAMVVARGAKGWSLK